MIDIKLIRENRDLVKENIKKKFQDEKLPLVDEIYDLDIEYRDTKLKMDEMRAEKNSLIQQGSWSDNIDPRFENESADFEKLFDEFQGVK